MSHDDGWEPVSQLAAEEWDELLVLLERKFGPRPASEPALGVWKRSRYGYLYSAGRSAYERLKKEMHV